MSAPSPWLRLLGVRPSTPVEAVARRAATSFVALFALFVGLLSLPFMLDAQRTVVVATLTSIVGMAGLLAARDHLDDYGPALVCGLLLCTTLAHVVFGGLTTGHGFLLLFAVAAPAPCFARRSRTGPLLFTLLGLAGYVWAVSFASPPSVDLGIHPALFQVLMIATGAGLVGLGLVQRQALGLTQELLLVNQSASEQLLDELSGQDVKMTVSGPRAERYDDVTVLVVHIVDFIRNNDQLPPTELIPLLDTLYASFDTLVERRDGLKLKTIADRYYVAIGVDEASTSNAPVAVELAIRMMAVTNKLSTRANLELQLRFGIATGSLVTALVGMHNSRRDVFGSALFEAEALERHGLIAKFNLDQATAAQLDEQLRDDERVLVEGRRIEREQAPSGVSVNMQSVTTEDRRDEQERPQPDTPEPDESGPPVVDTHPASGSVLLGAYRIGEALGRWGAGPLYAGYSFASQRSVAIRLVQDTPETSGALLARLQRELEPLKHLSHPNLAQVLDTGHTDEGLIYVVTQPVGTSLERFVHAGGLEAPLAIELFLQICAGVGAAHAKGLVHRALSPANVFVQHAPDSAPVVELLGFGLAKVFAELSGASGQTDQLVGTPGFLAPEQIKHEIELGPHTDIYALGALLHFLLSGERAFPGELAADIVFNQLVGERRPLASQYAPYAAAISRALSLDPGERYATVDALASAVRNTNTLESKTLESSRHSFVPFTKTGMVLGDAYRLEEEIGRGGMGAVYRAFQLSLQRDVAVKVLRLERQDDPVAFERFRREIDIVSRLAHHNIVQIIDAGTDDNGFTYLVMELLEGQSLRDFVPRGGLEPALALTLMRQICEGIQAAHAKGVIHRDLTPNNVFLTGTKGRTPKVKILDFGLAKSISTAETQLTADNQMMGTPGFMAPEQINQKYPVRETTDIYALGALLFYMLCGQRAFKGDSVAAVVLSQISGKIRPFSPQHAGFRQVIRRSLELVPMERPASVAEFLTVLELGQDSVMPTTIPDASSIEGSPHAIETLTQVPKGKSSPGPDTDPASKPVSKPADR